LDPRVQRRVQRYGWDKAASHYEGLWGEQLAPAQARMLDLANLVAGESVLDVACGTGISSFAAAGRVGPSGRLLGIDLSEAMIEIARRRVPGDNVRFERMDAEELRIGDSEFDVALCGLGLMYMPDPVRAVSEMRRVARRAVAVVWGARNRCGWADIFPIVDARVKSEVCPLFFALGSGDRLRALFQEAGFEDVVHDRFDTELRYANDDEACDAAFVGGPVALAWSRFDEQARREARAEYLASIQRYRDGEGYRVQGEFVVAAGRRPRPHAGAGARPL
jgi:ubiquinone/menaquinone biosynthesis C-methylase UbiE